MYVRVLKRPRADIHLFVRSLKSLLDTTFLLKCCTLFYFDDTNAGTETEIVPN